MYPTWILWVGIVDFHQAVKHDLDPTPLVTVALCPLFPVVAPGILAVKPNWVTGVITYNPNLQLVGAVKLHNPCIFIPLSSVSLCVFNVLAWSEPLFKKNLSGVMTLIVAPPCKNQGLSKRGLEIPDQNPCEKYRVKPGHPLQFWRIPTGDS